MLHHTISDIGAIEQARPRNLESDREVFKNQCNSIRNEPHFSDAHLGVADYRSTDMHVRLRAIDQAAGESRGKSMELSCVDFQISTYPPNGGLTLRAQEEAFSGTGERDGVVKEYKRTLEISMSALELKRVVEAAIEAGLLGTAIVLPADA